MATKPVKPTSGIQKPPGWDRAFFEWIESVDLRLSALIKSLPSELRKIAGSSSALESESFPFKCVAKDTTTITVQGYNTSEDRYFKNYAIFGLSQNEVPETDVSDITSDCWIYLRVSYSDEYSIVVEGDSSLPEQTATEMFIPLAFVKCADSKISSISQVQYGIIHYPGRVF